MTDKIVARKRRDRLRPPIQEGCQTEKCLLRDPFGECCARYAQFQRKQPDGSLYSYWCDAKTTAVERFWSKVAITADDTRCWNWTAGKTPYGYGIFCIHNDQNLAHRFSWFLHTGEKPSQWILHKCNNTSCVNPKHLYDGTPKDNALDRLEAGRQGGGGRQYTDLQVISVQRLLQGGVTHLEIHRITGVSTTVISNISRGKRKCPTLTENLQIKMTL